MLHSTNDAGVDVKRRPPDKHFLSSPLSIALFPISRVPWLEGKRRAMRMTTRS